MIIYRASDMILSCESDAAYLVAPKSRSRAGGYHYLGNKTGTQFNGPIYVLAKIIKAVMGSAAEAEVGGLYMNALELSPMRTTLEELDHPQPPTPLKTTKQSSKDKAKQGTRDSTGYRTELNRANSEYSGHQENTT